MAMITGWVLLSLLSATVAPRGPAREGVCGLKSLFTAERATFGEKDRYDPSPALVGFLPLPCRDGTRPAASGDHAVGGCRFIFTVTEAGSTPEELRAEAQGVGAGVEGLRFLVDDQGRITRAGTQALVPEPDCEAWRREADPLWRYHDAVMDHDCVSGPYAAKHPCAAALADLAAQARAGVGVAQKEYAAHPTARELFPNEPVPPAMMLCGLLGSDAQRAQAAETLERDGALLAAVLTPDCRPGGLRAAMPHLLRRYDTLCPGEHCLRVLSLARGAQVPGLEERLAPHAAALAEAIILQPRARRWESLRGVVGLEPPLAAPLGHALDGEWPGLSALKDLPPRPLVLALLDRVRLAHPELSAHLELLRELEGRGPASPATFRAWADTVPCQQLADAHLLELSPARLRQIAETHPRCQGDSVSLLQRYTRKLPPAQLMEVLKPLTNEQVGWIASSLGLDEPERAGALVDWAMDRDVQLIQGLCATVPVVQKLLAPRNANRLGGREAVIDLLLKRRGVWHGTMQDDARILLFQEALQGTPPPERVRHVASHLLPPEELGGLLAGVLRSPEARLRAAAAGGLAVWPDNPIPRDAARACLVEVREVFQCLETVARPLGPPPAGGRSNPLFASTPTPLDEYCRRLGESEACARTTCGGAVPDARQLGRLETAAQEVVPIPDVWRACVYVP